MKIIRTLLWAAFSFVLLLDASAQQRRLAESGEPSDTYDTSTPKTLYFTYLYETPLSFSDFVRSSDLIIQDQVTNHPG